jgi:hypothetical protein
VRVYYECVGVVEYAPFSTNTCTHTPQTCKQADRRDTLQTCKQADRRHLISRACWVEPFQHFHLRLQKFSEVSGPQIPTTFSQATKESLESLTFPFFHSLKGTISGFKNMTEFFSCSLEKSDARFLGIPSSLMQQNQVKDVTHIEMCDINVPIRVHVCMNTCGSAALEQRFMRST